MTTNPTPSAKLDEVTDVVVKAVPEIATAFEEPCDFCGERVDSNDCQHCTWGYKRVARDITLEDVLRAWKGDGWTGFILAKMKWKPKWVTWTDGAKVIIESWEIGLPLHQQRPQTIAFLHHILCHE